MALTADQVRRVFATSRLATLTPFSPTSPTT